MPHQIRHRLRNRHLLLLDALLLTASPLVAYGLRFESFVLPTLEARTGELYTALALPTKLLTFYLLGLYCRLWRQATVSDMVRVVHASAVAAAACSLIGAVVLPLSGLTGNRVPLSVLGLDAFFTAAIVAAPRLAARAFRDPRAWAGGSGRRALVAGAGAAGELVVKELRANPRLGLTPIGFVDDDGAKHGQQLCALPILGAIRDIGAVVAREQVEEILIAMPNAPGSAVRRVVQAALAARIHTRTVPGLFDILSGRVGVSQLRRVEIQDLLRREPIHTDLDMVRTLVRDRVVLVTGAGGSIGSELCRQLAQLAPARLVLLGHGENSIFEIQQELARRHPDTPLEPVIADVRDRLRMEATFERIGPDLVFHAAAHKHVPLMEANIADAVTNNVQGTQIVVDCAMKYETGRLIQISSDKAVRPTSVMGTTKRVAELLVRGAALRCGRPFVSVRFGNVLGSRGSVVPIFLGQIQAGGPVTITHPRMRRYFMTIPEAVQLVLQAGALGRGGEVFVLDMGEPVRIVDLATDLIRLSGLEVGRDIEIRFTEPRPGERLEEELLFGGESVVATEHPKVLRARGIGCPQYLTERVHALVQAAVENRPEHELRGLLHQLVPEFAEPTDFDGEAPRAWSTGGEEPEAAVDAASSH